MSDTRETPVPANLEDICSFRHHWKRLARKGQCDTWGGMECRRVFKAWVDAGKPERIWHFILDQVNVIRIEQNDASLLWRDLGLRRSYPQERRPG